MLSKGLSRVFSSTTIQKHQFFGAQLFLTVQLSHPYMTTGKTKALSRWNFVGKVMSLLSNMHPTPVLLPGKSHGRRNLVGCGPWGRKESDMTERLHFYFSLSCIGEGNGNPFQYTCLENPMDRGAWQATVHGVARVEHDLVLSLRTYV